MAAAMGHADCRGYAGVTRKAPHVIRLKGPYDIAVEPSKANDGTLRLSRDTRHGEAGWRASRYVSGRWDEWYLFFLYLSGAIEATGGDPDWRYEAIRIARSAFL
jgi:hypothetical protein